MSEWRIEATTRTAMRKRLDALRRRGSIPAVLYGRGRRTEHLEVPAARFRLVFAEAGESSLVDVVVDGQRTVPSLVQDIQVEPVTGDILHVDFHAVSMTEKVEIDVALRFVGESLAVKELGGTLLKNKDTVKIECLPKDLVKEIDVDISKLKTFEDMIRLSDLRLPDGLHLKEPTETVVAQVEPPRSEEELKELETAVVEDVSQVEKVEKPKEEEAVEPAEGETKEEGS